MRSDATTTKSCSSTMRVRIRCRAWTSWRLRGGWLARLRNDFRRVDRRFALQRLHRARAKRAFNRVAYMIAPTIDLRILDERVRDLLPAYATGGAAGMDLRAS